MAWMERFNQDLAKTLGDSYVASFLNPEDEDYPTVRAYFEKGPVTVIKLLQNAGTELEGTMRIVLRPDADQALDPVKTYRVV